MTLLDTGSISAFHVPDDLVEHNRWGLWRFETRNDRLTKVPYQVNGKAADSTNPEAWTTFESASQALRSARTRYSGLGFAFFKPDGLVGIDLDDALDEHGEVKDWARGIVERFFDTYTEISPSGLGLKIWARGSLPANVPGVKVGDGAIELYDHARYFTVTARAFRDAPLEIEDHQADLLMLVDRLVSGRKGWTVKASASGLIPYGQQHNTLVSFCGTLRARNMCEEAIEACLQVVNEKQCEKPGTREHISQIVRSSRRWGTR